MANSNNDTTRWNSRTLRLQQRQQALMAIRQYLYSQQFLEVETPLLVKTTCPDAHIDSVETKDGYLVTSTEYQIKRLIVGGFKRLFTLTKNFRANDRGRYHSTEFTMLEWARAHETLKDIEDDAVNFIKEAFKALYPNEVELQFNGHRINILTREWERISVRNAFKQYLGLDGLGDFSLEPLLKAAKRSSIEIPIDFQQDKYLIISYLLDLLQSHLGKQTPTFLQEWPAYLTTSAPILKEDPSIAKRSELFIAGVEIADGFPFLTNASLQRHLFDEELKRRQEQGKPLVTIDEKYIQSLDKLPSGAGMALGIDRLIMVLTNASRIADVQAFDWDEL